MKLSKRITAWLIAVVIVAGSISFTPSTIFAANDPSNNIFDISYGAITVMPDFPLNPDQLVVTYYPGGVFNIQQTKKGILPTDNITIVGTTSNAFNTITVGDINTFNGNFTANITLDNVNVDVSGLPTSCAFAILGNATINLNLKGTNKLTSGSARAGLAVSKSALGALKVFSSTININAPDNTNALTAKTTGNGAGIGADPLFNTGTINFLGGTISGSSYSGAGIGGCAATVGDGGDGGVITVSSANLTGTSTYGAGIGGGYGVATGGAGGTITVNNGSVNGTSTYGAGIGGGNGFVNGGSGGNVTINNGTITAKSTDGAAIGGGDGKITAGSGGTLTINGGTVNGVATVGAGIGGGGSTEGTGGSGGTINVTGGTITATSTDGAGIGGGGGATTGGADSATVISGGTITATSIDGAGIGGGSGAITGGSGSATVISDGVVTATSTNGAGIGGGDGGTTGGDGGSVTIQGGTVTATSTSGAGIGGGDGGVTGGSGASPLVISGFKTRAFARSVSAADIGGTSTSPSSGTLTTSNTDQVVLASQGTSVASPIHRDSYVLENPGNFDYYYDVNGVRYDAIRLNVTQPLPSAEAGKTTVYHVEANGAAGTTPNGSIVLKANGVVVSKIPLVNGVADLSWMPDVGGTYALSIEYVPEPLDTFGGRPFTAANYSVAYGNIVSASLTASPDPATGISLGDSISLTANISPSNVELKGTITFKVNDTVIQQNVPIVNGVASYVWTPSLAGNYNFVAVYEPGIDDIYTAVHSPIGMSNYIVKEAVTSTIAITLATSPLDSIAVGNSVDLTANINSIGATPTGTVTFKVGDTVISEGVAIVGNVATTQWTPSASGTYNFTANYIPDINESITITQQGSVNGFVVTNAVTDNHITISLTSSPASNVTTSDTVTFLANISPTSVTPTGTIQFAVNGSVIASGVTINNSLATCTWIPPAAGDYQVTATYIPSSNDTLVASQPGEFAVFPVTDSGSTLHNIALNLTSGVNAPVLINTSVPLTVDISPAGQNPTGTITLKANGVVIASGLSISNDKATFSWTPATSGLYDIVATYAPSQNDTLSASSSSIIAGFQVNNSPSTPTAITLSLTVSKMSSVRTGDLVDLVATVTPSGLAPKGTVTFSANKVDLSPAVGAATPAGSIIIQQNVPIVNDKASFTWKVPQSGGYVLFVAYNPAPNDNLVASLPGVLSGFSASSATNTTPASTPVSTDSSSYITKSAEPEIIENPAISIQAPYGKYDVSEDSMLSMRSFNKAYTKNKLSAKDFLISYSITDVTREEGIASAYRASLSQGKPLTGVLKITTDLTVKKSGNSFKNKKALLDDIPRLIPMPKELKQLPKHFGVFRLTDNKKGFEFTPHTTTIIEGITYIVLKSNKDGIYTVMDNHISFNDVKSGAWYASSIEQEAAKGLVDGVGEGLFEPDKAVTRAEFVQMIVNAIEPSAKDITQSMYTDIPKDTWYSESVMTAKSVGFLDVFGGTEFKPTATITREEMATIIAAALRYRGIVADSDELARVVSFTDSNMITTSYLSDIEFVVRLGIMSGIGNGNFNPKGNVTRAQAVVVQIRLMQKIGSLDQMY